VSAGVSPDAGSLATAGTRSPLEQLLHALNQPLTGLQCSMEVALASPRTPEQYVQGLREGLELTERMRALVEAIREVADAEGETSTNNKEAEAIELAALLREVVDDLNPVAEVKRVRIAIDGSAASSVWVKAGGRRRLWSLVFRMLESVLSVADRGSAIEIETSGVADGAADGAWFCVRWRAGKRPGEFSRPALGLLVAQAGWEGVGAKWERERTENVEAVTVWLPGVPARSRNF
jgi:signal transduction histidine kinase